MGTYMIGLLRIESSNQVFVWAMQLIRDLEVMDLSFFLLVRYLILLDELIVSFHLGDEQMHAFCSK